MIIVDTEIRRLGEALIENYDDSRVQSVCYDLRTAKFHGGQGVSSIKLKPLDSVFVQAFETIHLPADMIARVYLRNSRIRQGLSIAAPVYQPGHVTPVYFRITNISDKEISLSVQDDFASVMFERLGAAVGSPYSGAFQGETAFAGLSSYEPLLSSEMGDLPERIEEAKKIERNIYANVLQLMAIFVGIFSLVNVNIISVINQADPQSLLSVNLSTIGAIAFLLGAADCGKRGKWLFAASVCAFACYILVQLIL